MSELKLYDNTRLSSHRGCPRRYYWRHVRHLTPVGTKPALAFGACWHNALDAVWKVLKSTPDLSDTEVARYGYASFTDLWTTEYNYPLWEQMSMDQQEEFNFRHDETAYHMLLNYVQQRRSMIARMKLIEIEKPFAVPLDPENPNLFYVGRLDKVVEWDGAIWAIEHKTTSLYRKSGYFSSTFLESFSPNSQVDGYLHALHMLYGNRAKGVMVDAALVHKTVHEGFAFIPIERQFTQLEAWQWEALYEASLIENSLNHVENFSDAPFLPAFPKHTGSCTEFNTSCAYMDICRFIPNPTTEPDREFPGFKTEKWEPFEELGLNEIFKDQADDREVAE